MCVHISAKKCNVLEFFCCDYYLILRSGSPNLFRKIYQKKKSRDETHGIWKLQQKFVKAIKLSKYSPPYIHRKKWLVYLGGGALHNQPHINLISRGYFLGISSFKGLPIYAWRFLDNPPLHRSKSSLPSQHHIVEISAS